ncbi:hypothetical protein [Streptomyces sp. NPDC055681]
MYEIVLQDPAYFVPYATGLIWAESLLYAPGRAYEHITGEKWDRRTRATSPTRTLRDGPVTPPDQVAPTGRQLKLWPSDAGRDGIAAIICSTTSVASLSDAPSSPPAPSGRSRREAVGPGSVRVPRPGADCPPTT